MKALLNLYNYVLWKRNIFFSRREFFAFIAANKVSQELKELQKNTFYEKVSLGQNCNSAWYLKSTQNKRASYPFDWIFTSFEIIEHCIQNKFNKFLDRKEIVSLSSEKAGHQLYHSSMFNHRNPLISQQNYDYYERCVVRFMNLLKNNTPTFFICFVINEPDKRISWSKGFNNNFSLPINQDVNSANKVLELLNANLSNCKFLFINQTTEGNLSLKYDFYSKNLIWVDFTAKGKNSGLKYLDHIDDRLMKIIFNGFSTNNEKNN